MRRWRCSSAPTTQRRTISSLEAIRDLAGAAGILLDFDGSLSPIVGRPERAGPIAGAREAVARLVGRYRVVALITGRRAAEARRLLDVDGVRYEGLYGLEELIDPPSPALRAEVEAVAQAVAQAWVEEKGLSLSVHYRQARDPAAARATLVGRLGPLAERSGLRLLEGKMVLELVPEGRPLKGGAVERLVGELGLRAALYGGDDVADLDAFEALDRLSASGIVTMRVAVRGDETPDELVEAADLVVEGPAGLVELLRSL